MKPFDFSIGNLYLLYSDLPEIFVKIVIAVIIVGTPIYALWR
jgi:hypothetical protein